MNKFYKSFFILLFFSVFFPIAGFSSHIVGGSLTYTYLGSNQYTVTLKLYRDTSGIAVNASYPITVLQANGSVFSPNLNFNVNEVSNSKVALVLPPCSSAPSPRPGVEEYIFTNTVTLPPVPGGYHLYTSFCCRNNAIVNISSPGTIGETFYAYIPCYNNIWAEDFNLADGTTSDAGPTAWTTTMGSTPVASAQVSSGVFAVTYARNGSMTWTSQVINISSYASGVNLSVDASKTGTLRSGDSLKIYYSLNGGAQILFPTNGQLLNNFTSPAFATASGLVGSTIQIFIKIHYHNTTTSSAAYNLDMVSVYDNTFLPNSSPVYNQLPPLLICQGNQDTLDYSATDADGDNLVYSLYTPYTDGTITFPDNVASFTPVTWIPSYSATSPFNSPAPALSINSATGQLSGVANTNGRFVFGVMCSEYRGGVLLSQTVRDYEVSTVTCPPWVPPAPTAGTGNAFPICSGQTLSLTASTVVGATGYSWTGPNGFTSTLQNPTISNVTTAAAGTYSVSATVTGCNSPVGTVTVAITSTPAAPTASSNSAVCSGSTLSLTASTIAGSTYSWTGPNSFSSSSQNPTIASVTTDAAGTYTITDTKSGCTSSVATTTVTVNQTPTAPTAGNNSPVCAGQTVSLTASSTGTTYAWTGPNSFSSSSQNPTVAGVTTAASGTYSVTATTSGCTGTAGTTSVTVSPIPVAPTVGSNSPICVGVTLSLTASNIAGASYNWNGPNSFSSAIQNPTIASVTTANGGTYSVTATVAGCTGIVGTASVTVNTIPSAPSASSNSPICSGSNLNLSAGAIAGATYSWNGPNSFSSASQNPSIAGATTAATGTYSVTATVSGCSGSAGTTTVTVNAIPSAPVAGSNSPVCSGQTLSLGASTVIGATYSWNGPNSFSSASQNPSIVGVTTDYEGTYSVTATVSGCTGAAGTTSVVINQTPSAPTAGSNTPVCSGSTLSLTSSSISGATYSWNGPNSFSSASQNPTIAGVTTLASGTYSVAATVTGCSGPAGTTSVTITQTPSAPTAGSNSPICEGNNLSLTASPISGATYSWNGPNSFSSALQNPSIAGVTTDAAGTYSVTATVSGCTGTIGTTTVNVNATPSTPSAGSNSPMCTGTTLSLTANTIAGATYSWNGPNSFSSSSQNPTVSNVTTADGGLYSVTATVSGCIGAAGTVSVTISPPPATPSAGSNSTVCTGYTLSLTASTITGATYSWSGPNGFSSASQNPTLTAVTTDAAGTYSVNATVGGCTGATGTTVVSINVSPSPPSAGSNTPACSGQTLSLTASTVAGVTYTWEGPNSFSSSSQNPTIPNATTDANGTYSVFASAANGCGSTPITITSVTINPTPAAVVGSNTPACIGGDLSLTATTFTGATYSWSGPNSFSSVSQNPVIPTISTDAAGTYSVIATAAGCVGPVGTGVVVVNGAPPTPTPGSNLPVCEGQTLSLSSNTIPAAVYTWNGPNSFSSASQNPTIAGVTTDNAGTYSVFATVPGCAVSGTGTISITVNPTPASPTPGSNSSICSGQDLSLTATTIGGATYSWDGPNSFSTTTQDPVISSASTAASGTYSVTAISGAGCISAVSTTVASIHQTPSAPIAGSNTPLCTGTTLSLSASTITGATYAWSGPNSYTSALQNPSIPATTTAEAGTYSVTATVAGCTGPTGVTTVSVTVPQTTTPSGNTPVCSGQELSLTTSTVTGATYSWTGPNVFSSVSQNPTISNITTSGNGTYSVTATVSGCTGPVGTTLITVNQTPSAPVAGNNSAICEGQTLSLTVSNTGTTYTWSGPNGYSSSTQNPSISGVTTVDAGTYTVNTTTNGCTSTDATTLVTINPTPSSPIAGSNSAICSGQTLSLTASTIGGSTYAWSGPLGFSSTLQDPTIVAASTSQSGTYSVTASSGGCTSTAGTTSVTVNQTPSIAAGSNGPVCQGNTISLTATTIAGGTYSWNGPNSFSSTSQNPTIAGATTVNSGTYTVNASSSAGCLSVNAFATFTVTPTISVAAGLDQTVCANNATTSLIGVVTGGTTTAIWATSGAGSFVPGAINLSTNYIPSNADTASGMITLTLTSTNNGGCTAVSDGLILTITNAPTVNAGADQTVCANNADVSLNGSVNSAATGGNWASMGTGTFTPSSSTLNATYHPSAADTTAGSVKLVLTTSGVGNCSPVTDTIKVTVTHAPRVNAGADISVCSNNPNASLNGYSTTGSGTWATLGSGSFSPNANTLNATYVPSAGDISGGNVKLILTSTNNATCNAVKDTVAVFFTPPPTVNAGTDQTVCANNNTVSLSGTTSTGSGHWTSSGTGIFSPNSNSLNASYTPSAADNSAGHVTLTLTTTNNGGCLGVADQMSVTITPAPTANAGVDQTACANNAVVSISGSFTIATGAIWSSSGTGTFAPNNTTMNATYTPSAADTAAGSVNIILTTTGNGLCNAVTDTMVVTISNAPLVNAGADISVCINNPNASLNGYSSTGSGTWATLGTGTFSPNANTLSASYVPSAADISGGSIKLILTSTNNATCNAVKDTVNIFFTPPPTVNAGTDQTVCANNNTVSLSGTSSIGAGMWSTSGTGTFSPNANTLNATYNPNAADTAAHSITLTLSSANNGGCVPVTDQLTVTITPAPTVNAGADQTVCANNDVVNLNGSFTLATGATWTTSGTGTFSPDNITMNATYTPSNADTAAHSVILTLTTTGNGLCNAVTDAMVIIITNKPIVVAGINTIACNNNSNVPLNGSSSTGAGTWTTSGTGTFSPDENTLNATYISSPADTVAGSVVLTLTSANNGNCGIEHDSITITYISKPIVNAGVDQTVCANNADVSLNGLSNTNAGQWTSLGSGTFLNSNSLSTSYTPSANDVSAGNVKLVLASTNNGTCNSVTDTMVVSFSTSPSANAGADQMVCANNAVVTLNGSFTVSSGGGWTTLGTGTFSPDTSTMNATYTPSATDTAAREVKIVLTTTGNGTCISVSDTMLITITTAPKVNAGNDRIVCKNNPVANLSGISSTGSGQWSTLGSGNFANANLLATTYTASTADTTAGSVKLVLTTTNNSLCNEVTDTLVLNFVDIPVVNAGIDQTVCANADTVSLSGTSTTGAAQWSSAGDGIFLPHDTSLNATYIPGSADITAGTVTVSLTSLNGCTAVTNTMQITITPTPIVDPGVNQIICAGTNTVALSGSVSGGATTGQWSTSGTGTFVPNNTIFNPTYVLSSADSVSGIIALSLTSTNNGNCFAVTKSIDVSIVQPPVVNAGSDLTICSLPPVQLNGTVTGGSGTGVWSSTVGAGTFSPDSTVLNGLYYPGIQDTAYGTLILVLTSTNNGNCPASTDSIRIRVSPPPGADAGSNVTLCRNNADSIPLSGSVSYAGGGQWSTLGSGTFSPTDSTLNGYYHPSVNDISQNTLKLVLTTTGNGMCSPGTDTMYVFFTPSPVVNAGVDIEVCSGDTLAQLNGSVSGGTNTGLWSTLGSGNFSPDNVTLNSVYTLSASDTASGNVSLILISTNNGNCIAVTDTINIKTKPIPVVNAGNDVTVCANNANITLNGSVTAGSTSGIWSSNGTGTFVPSDTILNAVYQPSDADTASGSVKLILSSTHGCRLITDSLNITITNAPVVTAGSNVSICQGAVVSINGSISTATGGQWTSTGNGTFMPNDSTLNATYIPGSNDTSNTTLVLSSTGNGQCIAVRDSMKISIGRKPIAGFSNATGCTGQTVTFTDTSSVAGANDIIVSWNWNIAGGNSTTQNPTHVFASAGSDSVSLIVMTNIGCLDTIIRIININPSPTALFGYTTNCQSDTVHFIDSSSISSGAINSWNWNFGDGNNGSVQNPVHSYTTSGTYTVSLSVTSDSGCTATITDAVVPSKRVVVGFQFSADCQFNVLFKDSSVVLASGDSIISWMWSFPGGTPPAASTYSAAVTYSVQGNYTAQLNVTTAGGCSGSVTDTLTLQPLPIADFVPEGGTYNAGEGISFTDLSTNVSVWNWNFGDGSFDSIQNPSHTYTQPATLNVELIVMNSAGCPDTAKYTFIINANTVAIPSAFTPNGDGHNDVLYVRGGPLKEMDWRIFNEWDNELFHATTQDQGWDGTYRSKAQPAARYVYTLTGTTYSGDKIDMKGNVTIIR